MQLRGHRFLHPARTLGSRLRQTNGCCFETRASSITLLLGGGHGAVEVFGRADLPLQLFQFRDRGIQAAAVLAFDALEHRQALFDRLEAAGVGVEGVCVSPELHGHVGDFLLDGSEAQRLRFQPGVELRGRAHRRQRSRDTVLVERAQRFVTELGEARGVSDR